MDHEGNQSNGTRNLINVNLVPKDVQKILSLHQISQKYKEQWGVFYTGAVLKNFLRKYLCWNPEYFFDKNAGL